MLVSNAVYAKTTRKTTSREQNHHCATIVSLVSLYAKGFWGEARSPRTTGREVAKSSIVDKAPDAGAGEGDYVQRRMSKNCIKISREEIANLLFLFM